MKYLDKAEASPRESTAGRHARATGRASATATAIGGVKGEGKPLPRSVLGTAAGSHGHVPTEPLPHPGAAWDPARPQPGALFSVPRATSLAVLSCLLCRAPSSPRLSLRSWGSCSTRSLCVTVLSAVEPELWHCSQHSPSQRPLPAPPVLSGRSLPKWQPRR